MNPLPSERSDSNTRKTILVIEGDIFARTSAADQLRAADFTVLEAANSGEALVLLRAFPNIALVVTDLHSSGSMNGAAIAEWLNREMPHIKVLLAPGSDRSDAAPMVQLIARIRALLA